MPLRDAILTNFWQKIVSLVLAMLIWFAIDSHLKRDTIFPNNPLRGMHTRDFRREIRVMTSATNARAFKVDPKVVDVRISGDNEKVRRFNPEDIEPYVELTAVETNSFVPIKVRPPRDVTLETIWPTNVYVEFIIPEI